MRLLVLCALVASIGAVAAIDQQELQKRQAASSAIDELSVLAVLVTALPTSLIVLAATNEAAASSAILAEFATGTPSWYANLPLDVQSYLLAPTTVSGLGSITTIPSSQATQTTFTRSVSTRSVDLDLPSSITTYPGFSSAASAAATATGFNNSVNQDEGGLSMGAKIGIGVGVGVGLIALAAAIGICIVGRRRRARQSAAAPAPAPNTYQPQMPEKQPVTYQSYPQGQTYGPQGLAYGGVPAGTTQMPTYANISEMPAAQPQGYTQSYPQYAELPATQGPARNY